MARLTSPPDDSPMEHVEIRLAGGRLEFESAQEAATSKAREICRDPMLLAWQDRQRGAFYPAHECGRAGDPPWKVYAEARGGNLTIEINDGEYTFIYLKL